MNQILIILLFLLLQFKNTLLLFEDFDATINKNDYLMKTWKNNTFYGFRGIQYAEAPINELRFRNPKPISLVNWWTMGNFTNNGNPCPSPYTKILNENCLYLNVYTRTFFNLSLIKPSAQLHKKETATLLKPVIVFIHPGGFYVGSGNSDKFGAEYLLEMDIVLVTFNYRLGFFGFASTGATNNDQVYGNFGLKDQTLVLKWIQNNIHYFGGNSNLVTLMGNSAGAMSVALHLLSTHNNNNSNWLFHRSIIMSGGILPQLKLPQNQLNLLERQVNLLKRKCTPEQHNHSGAPQRNLFDCIKNENTEFFAKNIYSIFEYGHDNPIYLWLPVIESSYFNDSRQFSKVEGEKHFLTYDPSDKLLTNDNFIKVPTLMGVTKNEFGTSSYDIIQNETLLKQWIYDFNKIAPICLHYERDTERSIEISSFIWNHYFGNTTKTNNNVTFENLNKCFSDALINFPIHRLAKRLQNFTDVYYYKFTYRGRFTNFPIQNDSLYNEIVEHGDELQYIFTSNDRPKILPTDPEAKIVERFVQLIGNFAKNGYPNDDNNIPQKWLKFDEKEEYIDIGYDIISKSKPFENYQFWNNLFPIKNELYYV